MESDTSSPPASPGIVHGFAREFHDPAAHHGRHEHHQNGDANEPSPVFASGFYVPPQYLPHGRRALSGISVRAYCLGIALGISTIFTLQLAYFGYGLWRASAFIAILSLFHYLEFDSTARYNPADASLSSFLLLSNGVAYASAHAAATVELLLRCWLYSEYKPQWLRRPFEVSQFLPAVPSTVTVPVGIFFIVVGQFVRREAMRKAATNFNHIVQWAKKADHVLVTDGIYGFSRHPAYFGFFWWGLGTQILLENKICLVGYAAVLWKFFSQRISRKCSVGKTVPHLANWIQDEERHLVSFFGQEYLDYRRRVPVRIPFIR